MVRLLVILLCLTGRGWAADGPVRLGVPEVLVASGLMAHLLPRFALKTQLRVEVVPEGAPADLILGAEGVAVFADQVRMWHLSEPGDHDGAARFAQWLTSDVGRNTVTSYAPGGAALFTLPVAGAAPVADIAHDGDAALGLIVSRTHCGRCHAVEPGGQIKSIGSSPSFAVLKSLDDWAARFEAFYALNPHPSFTQIPDVTPPFPEDRPPPIAPMALTLEELEAIVAYVAALDAADLGSPLRHQ
ncbi:MAG: c-type cytochrome [Pseudomonadota bacterium]